MSPYDIAAAALREINRDDLTGWLFSGVNDAPHWDTCNASSAPPPDTDVALIERSMHIAWRTIDHDKTCGICHRLFALFAIAHDTTAPLPGEPKVAA